MSGAPHLEPRRADEFADLLRTRRPAYVPGWAPPPGGPGEALLLIAARFLAVVGERVDRTPEKAQLAFLDQLGLDALPAQAARAPVVIEGLPQLGDGRIPAGTRLAAQPPEGGEPLVFETEAAIALVAARLAEVVTVWPGRDAYADHSADAAGGRPFELWSGLQPIAHELYLGHDAHLALAGRSSVELAVELATAGSAPLAIAWQHWDGELWRDLAAPRRGDDTTAGLTRGGTITLRTDCGHSERRAVGGRSSHWLRGRLTGPLPPDGTRVLPAIDRVRLRTVCERDVGGSGAGGLPPDRAFAGGAAIDTSKAFEPFGPAPSEGVAFYVACDEAFSRPGAEVTIGLSRKHTEQEKRDIEVARYELGVNEAKARVDQLKRAVADLDALLRALVDPATGELRADSLPLFDAGEPEAWYAEVRRRMQDALDAIRGMAGPAQATRDSVGTTAAALLLWDLNLEPVSKAVQAVAAMILLHVPLAVIAVSEAAIVAGLGDAANALSSGDPTLKGHVEDLQQSLTDVNADIAAVLAGDPGAAFRILDASPTLLARWLTVASELDNWPPSIWLDAALPGIFVTARQRYALMRGRIDTARQRILDALGDTGSIGDLLDELTPEIAAAAAGLLPPEPKRPQLSWQYFDGTRWRALQLTSVDADGDPSRGPRHFAHGRGRVGFTVPADWRATTINTEEALWLRVVIRSGAFAVAKLVTWFDERSGSIQHLPITLPRPPLLDVFTIGYHWRSDAAPPQHCLTRNDFRWADRSEAAAWHGDAFAPFTPTEDASPTLYLGFDRPLPADQLGLFAALACEGAGAGLEWEGFHDGAWLPAPVEDETGGLGRSGAVRVLWPGGPAPAAVPLLAAAAGSPLLRLADARAAAAFAPGDQLWIATGEDGELGTVARVEGDTLALRAPLAAAHPRGTVAHAGLPRFGTPRTWLRARLRLDGDPPPVAVRGLHVNATWAAHAQTVRDELLGSSDGQPRQSLRFTRAPVLRGARVEVRELDGPRAAVEYPLLVAELAGAGIAERDVRTVVSPRSGAISEVWVPWREQPTLLFSGPLDRHYAVERDRGRLLFGDGVNGRIPPAGANCVRARSYRSGGGAGGNVPEGAIDQVLTGVLAQRVANPVAADGGADGEPAGAILVRGPLTLRHRRQAVAAADYEALALEASGGVGLARALPATRPDGRPAPGWVTVVIVPRGTEAEPQPSAELRHRVRAFLLERAPAALAGRLAVVGPAYQRVGVTATIVPRLAGDGGPVAVRARAALATFLHPLAGGPEGAGWGTRRPVCVSDVAVVLERVDGVDHVAALHLVDRGTPTGDVLEVAQDRLVAAGPVDVRLGGAER